MNGLLESLSDLLAAARSPDESAPRAEYCAAARRAFDLARDELKTLEGNLCALEAHLLGAGALVERSK